jgi:phosphoribosylanthranilate isomerase
MPRTRIKICGVCRVEDAAAAARLGADAVGLVFHAPSPRNVPVETAERIVAALPGFVTAVGLFVDAPVADVVAVCRRLRLGLVQLHGREPPRAVAEVIDETGAAVLKAVRVDRRTLPAELDAWREAVGRWNLSGLLKGLVLETAAAPSSAPGGTGAANDWEAVRVFQEAGAFRDLPPLIAAGGLDPASVGGVVRWLRPWAVDVSSGVEVVRGQKSEEKIRAFVEAVRAADAEGEGDAE